MGEVARAYAIIGRPDAEITGLAGEIGAGLVVVGSRGLGALERLTLGSVSEGVVHHATRPVLVARGGEEAWPPRRIVIGDDGSEAARDAGALAAGIGGLFGAKGILVRAYPGLPEMDLREPGSRTRGWSTTTLGTRSANSRSRRRRSRRRWEADPVSGSMSATLRAASWRPNRMDWHAIRSSPWAVGSWGGCSA